MANSNKKKPITSMFSILKYAKKSTVVMIIISISALAALFFSSFHLIYENQRENLANRGRTTAFNTMNDINKFLEQGLLAVDVLSYSINSMMMRNASDYEIRSYLVSQSNTFTNALDSSFFGAYGLFNGTFLGGVGFEPESDFDPLTRPWYTAAINSNGQTTLVSPYENAQTHTTMMSISKQLSNKDDVVAVDMSLRKLQKTFEDNISDEVAALMLLDDSGKVIVHSDLNEVGKNYFEDSTGIGAKIHGILTKEISPDANYSDFEIKHDGHRYAVCYQLLNDQWYVVSLTSEDYIYKQLNYIYFILTAFSVLMIFIAIRIIVYSAKRQKSVTELDNQIKSMGDIYLSIHIINLNKDTFKEIRSNAKDLESALHQVSNHARDQIRAMMDILTQESFKPTMMSFIDLDTLNNRLANVNTITYEFVDWHNSWSRARFVVVDRNKDSSPHHVMWLIEAIDKEKREHEKLRYLSETDQMTGINNRASGSKKIQEYIASGIYGLFIIIDADKFKSVNDNYGHSTGDKVIIEIAECMKRAFRGDDIIMRLGGDEFAAYLSTVADKKTADIIIDRFFREIDSIDIPTLGDHKINVSVGCAFKRNEDDHDFDALYQHADTCLYLSKEVVGNKATFFNDEP